MQRAEKEPAHRKGEINPKEGAPQRVDTVSPRQHTPEPHSKFQLKHTFLNNTDNTFLPDISPGKAG